VSDRYYPPPSPPSSGRGNRPSRLRRRSRSWYAVRVACTACHLKRCIGSYSSRHARRRRHMPFASSDALRQAATDALEAAGLKLSPSAYPCYRRPSPQQPAHRFPRIRPLKRLTAPHQDERAPPSAVGIGAQPLEAWSRQCVRINSESTLALVSGSRQAPLAVATRARQPAPFPIRCTQHSPVASPQFAQGLAASSRRVAGDRRSRFGVFLGARAAMTLPRTKSG
jgi:hypothetical protein